MKEDRNRHNNSIQSDQIKTSSRATLVYLLLSVLPSGLKVFLLPIYVNHLSPADYGILSLLTVFGSFYGIVAIMQINIAAGIDYFKVSDTHEYERSIFSTSLFIGVFTSIIFLLIGPFLFDWLFSSVKVDFYSSGWIVVGSTLLVSIQGIFFVFLRNSYRLKELTIYTTLLVVSSTALQFYFIVYLRLGYKGPILGSLIANALIMTLILIKNFRLLTARLKLSFVKGTLAVSVPMIFTVFFTWVHKAGDRIYLEKFLSLEKVGVYTVFMTILGFSLLIIQAYGMAIRPIFFKYLDDLKMYKKNLNELIGQFVMLIIISASGVLLIGSNLDLLTTQEKYLEITPYFFWGLLIVVPQMLIKIPRMQLLYQKRTKLISLYSVIGAFLVISLIPLLISLGIKGVIIAISISKTIEFLLHYISFRKAKIPHKSWVSLKVLIISSLAIILAYFLSNLFELSSGIFGLLQFIFVTAVLFFYTDKAVILAMKNILTRNKND